MELDEVGVRKLAAAVIVDAVLLVRRGDVTPIGWLLIDGLAWLDGLGLDIDPTWWRNWVESGCPGGETVTRNLVRKKGSEQEHKPVLCKGCGKPTGHKWRCYCSQECKRAVAEKRKAEREISKARRKALEG
jgi:hypothetical protein